MSIRYYKIVYPLVVPKKALSKFYTNIFYYKNETVALVSFFDFVKVYNIGKITPEITILTKDEYESELEYNRSQPVIYWY